MRQALEIQDRDRLEPLLANPIEGQRLLSQILNFALSTGAERLLFDAMAVWVDHIGPFGLEMRVDLTQAYAAGRRELALSALKMGFFGQGQLLLLPDRVLSFELMSAAAKTLQLLF